MYVYTYNTNNMVSVMWLCAGTMHVRKYRYIGINMSDMYVYMYEYMSEIGRSSENWTIGLHGPETVRRILRFHCNDNNCKRDVRTVRHFHDLSRTRFTFALCTFVRSSYRSRLDSGFADGIQEKIRLFSIYIHCIYVYIDSFCFLAMCSEKSERVPLYFTVSQLR